MRIIYMGSGEFGCPTLRALSDSDHELLDVITPPARPAGRGKKTIATPVARLAEELDLPLTEAANVNQPDLVSRIAELQPDVILVIAFGQKIGSDLLNLPNCRVINLHGSLLPAYRGAAPINWAIINGEEKAGVTVIELNDAWDAGAMFGQSALTILPRETAGELHDRLALLGPDLVIDILQRITAGTDQPLDQNSSLASKAPKLRKADGRINWNEPAETIVNRILGLWPWPGAFSQLTQADRKKPQRVVVARAELAEPGETTATAEPGQFDNDLYVTCGQGRIHILELRPENSKLMTFSDFANGRRIKPGDRFTD